MSNVDFAPTVLDWLGLPPLGAVPGRTLLPAIRGEAHAGDGRPLYARMSAFSKLSDAVVYRDTKYVRFWNASTQELVATRTFDLRGDPRETRSVSDELGVGEALLSEAADTRGIEYPARFDPLEEEVVEKLRALGYLR